MSALYRVPIQFAMLLLWMKSLAFHAEAIPSSLLEGGKSRLPVIPHLTKSELRENQRADPCNREVIQQLESGVTPSPTVRAELPELSLLLQEQNHLVCMMTWDIWE